MCQRMINFQEGDFREGSRYECHLQHHDATLDGEFGAL
jgi:hypothetical protein